MCFGVTVGARRVGADFMAGRKLRRPPCATPSDPLILGFARPFIHKKGKPLEHSSRERPDADAPV